KELRFSGEPGMHGVPGLVREGVHVCKHILFVVHQYIRRCLVAAGGKCAAAFPLRFVTIAPAATQTVGECARVFLAEWSQGSNHFIDRLIKPNMLSNFGT